MSTSAASTLRPAAGTDSVTFRQATLANGLTIIAETDPCAHTAALGFFVRTGARDEPPAIMGVSHFLEHMIFKGTEQRSAEEVDRQFDDLGANHNAFTTSEMTAFYAHCLPEHLATAHDILADIMRPALRTQDFDNEKQVILEEIAMYDDQPFFVLYERMMEEFYGDHPLRHRVLGTAETIKALQRDAMEQYFRARYSADNTVVALAGNVDFDAMVQCLERSCGSWENTGATRPAVPLRVDAHEITETSERINRHYVMMMSPAPSIADDQRYAAGMLAQILGDSEGSRLYWALVDTGIAEEAQAFCDSRDGAGEFIVYAASDPANAAEVEQIMQQTMAELIASINDEDLARVRSKVATAATVQGELPMGRMRRIGQQWTYLREYRSLADELQRIDAVTLDDLRAVHRAQPIEAQVVGRMTPGRG